ncbi:hypothetical protein [Nocardia terpenica]
MLQLDDPDIDFEEFTAEDGLRTFALSEIMVCSDYAGQGVGVLCTTKY